MMWLTVNFEMFAFAEDKFSIATNVNTFFQDFVAISLVTPSPKRKKNLLQFHETAW